jgi:hypothetical protein
VLQNDGFACTGVKSPMCENSDNMALLSPSLMFNAFRARCTKRRNSDCAMAKFKGARARVCNDSPSKVTSWPQSAREVLPLGSNTTRPRSLAIHPVGIRLRRAPVASIVGKTLYVVIVVHGMLLHQGDRADNQSGCARTARPRHKPITGGRKNLHATGHRGVPELGVREGGPPEKPVEHTRESDVHEATCDAVAISERPRTRTAISSRWRRNRRRARAWREYGEQGAAASCAQTQSRR